MTTALCALYATTRPRMEFIDVLDAALTLMVDVLSKSALFALRLSTRSKCARPLHAALLPFSIPTESFCCPPIRSKRSLAYFMASTWPDF